MPDWSEVEALILQNVFFNFDPAAVQASRNLAAEGFMDSLSVIGIVTTVDECLGGELAQSRARKEDFMSIGTIKELYLRLIKEA
jgi:hypothetical protein